ncbi:MAG: transposase [Candidatus Kapabacteria bacterium]|nr:transposase [Candidatus Kapabacteria bacterium]
MIFNKDLSIEQLELLFTNEDKCLEFLAELKWSDGFICKKCGNTNSCAGKTPFSQRCTKCKTEESATAGTVFHNCRFELNKAFYIAYTVCKNKFDVSTYEFARRLSMRQMTCWKFKDKLKKAIESSGESPENWIEILK